MNGAIHWSAKRGKVRKGAEAFKSALKNAIEMARNEEIASTYVCWFCFECGDHFD